MKRYMLLSTTCAALVLVLASMASAQTVQTAPNNPDGSCPEGFVQVNAPFCAQESPNTPGRIFGFGESDLAPQTDNLRQTPDGLQYSDLPDVIPGETETTQYAAPVAETPTASATTSALPATGGPSLVLLAGVFLVGTRLLLRR